MSMYEALLSNLEKRLNSINARLADYLQPEMRKQLMHMKQLLERRIHLLKAERNG